MAYDMHAVIPLREMPLLKVLYVGTLLTPGAGPWQAAITLIYRFPVNVY